MPKKKKTRKQKELTDVRRKTESKITYSASIEPKTQTRQEHVSTYQPAPQPVRQTPSRTIVTADYKYLAGDLFKTLGLTVVIIAIQLGLKFGAGL